MDFKNIEVGQIIKDGENLLETSYAMNNKALIVSQQAIINTSDSQPGNLFEFGNDDKNRVITDSVAYKKTSTEFSLMNNVDDIGETDGSMSNELASVYGLIDGGNYWTTRSNMLLGSLYSGIGATISRDKMQYMFGSTSSAGSQTNYNYSFVLSTNSHTAAADGSFDTRYTECGWRVNSNEILKCAGYNGAWLLSTERYNSTANSWTARSQSFAAQKYNAAGPSPEFQVGIVVGGSNSGSTFTNSVDSFSDLLNTWASRSILPESLTRATGAGLGYGYGLVAGGQNSSGVSARIYKQNYYSDIWTTRLDSNSQLRLRLSTSFEGNSSTVFLAGGYDVAVNYSSALRAFTDSWNIEKQCQSMPITAYGQQTTALTQNIAVLVGGRKGPSSWSNNTFTYKNMYCSALMPEGVIDKNMENDQIENFYDCFSNELSDSSCFYPEFLDGVTTVGSFPNITTWNLTDTTEDIKNIVVSIAHSEIYKITTPSTLDEPTFDVCLDGKNYSETYDLMDQPVNTLIDVSLLPKDAGRSKLRLKFNVPFRGDVWGSRTNHPRSNNNSCGWRISNDRGMFAGEQGSYPTEGWIYTDSSNTWSFTSNMSGSGVYRTGAVSFSGGSGLIAGGQNSGSTSSTNTHFYFDANRTWTTYPLPSFGVQVGWKGWASSPQISHFSGGFNLGFSYRTWNYRWCHPMRVWNSRPWMSENKVDAAATPIGRWKGLQTGGNSTNADTRFTGFAYDEILYVWSSLIRHNTIERHSIFPVGNGKSLLTTGWCVSTFTVSDESLMLNANTKTAIRKKQFPRRIYETTSFALNPKSGYVGGGSGVWFYKYWNFDAEFYGFSVQTM